jgi:hypothetical protein
MRRQITWVALLAITLASGLATLDAGILAARGETAASALRVLAPTALLMIFLLHRPIDRI